MADRQSEAEDTWSEGVGKSLRQLLGTEAELISLAGAKSRKFKQPGMTLHDSMQVLGVMSQVKSENDTVVEPGHSMGTMLEDHQGRESALDKSFFKIIGSIGRITIFAWLRYCWVRFCGSGTRAV